MALYEHVFLARQDVSNAQVEALTKEFSDLIEQGGGKVTKSEYWGVKSLAYKIKKSRKAHFALTPLPAPRKPGDLQMMTIRSEGQFNTVVYEEEDLYRGVDRRDVVLMAAADAARLGLAEGQRVRVMSESGAMNVRVALVDIRVGNCAMYYPEANALVPARLDKRSKTPAFKSVAVTVEPLGTQVA